MKRRQEAAEEAERQRLQAEADARAAAEAEIEAARQAELSARDTSDAPGSPAKEEAGEYLISIRLKSFFPQIFLYKSHNFSNFPFSPSVLIYWRTKINQQIII